MAKDLLTDDQRKMLAKSFLALANIVLGALVFGQTFTDVGFSVISIILRNRNFPIHHKYAWKVITTL